MRDFKRMQTDPPAGVSASPIADNVMTWYDHAYAAAHFYNHPMTNRLNQAKIHMFVR